MLTKAAFILSENVLLYIYENLFFIGNMHC